MKPSDNFLSFVSAALLAAALAPSACHRDAQAQVALVPPADAGSGSGSETAKNKSDDAARSGEAAKGRGKGDGSGSGRRREAGPVPVRVTPAVTKMSPREVAIVAMLNGRRQADVYSKVTGRIKTLGPAEGEAVKAGTVLFNVDRSDPGETYLNTPVVSPIAGWVGRWRVTNVGEQVTPTDSVVTIVDDVALRSIVNLPASDWLLVKRDTKVTAELGGETRPATIQTIAVSADPASGRGGITIEIANPKRDWRVGMFATVTLALEPKQRMLISATSLTITDKGTFVYIADGETARRVPVKYSVIDSDTVEILSGLKDNAQVISAGGNLIGDGSQIRIVTDAAGGATGSSSEKTEADASKTETR